MAFELNHFREQYETLAKHYSLPAFNAVNNDFELEKISQESATMLRVVRKTMMEKIFNILNFLEMLLNPVNASRMYLPFIKVMTSADRKDIEKLYGIFGKLTLRALPLEVNYSEKQEAIMIKDIYGIWKDAKESLADLMERIATPIDGFAKKERSYYG